MSFIASYGCTSAAGTGAEALWDAVYNGRDLSASVPGQNGLKACLWPDHSSDAKSSDKLMRELHLAWREARNGLTQPLQNFGVIFASTKGALEDSVWQDEASENDFIGPLLQRFLKESELGPKVSITISNACSSSLSAMWLADRWLNASIVDSVVILAADYVGPFVLKGFHCLHALSTRSVRPFAETRDGLQLGEAAACVVLQRESTRLRLENVGLDAEGYAVTRPSPSGASLERAISKNARPDLIIAHATGTFLNDQTEDLIFQKLFPETWVTASKWCFGHTLGPSGLMDTILACETIRRKQSFRIANTEKSDPAFRGHYLTRSSDVQVAPSRVLITSLGFGGIHASASVVENPR